jgi:hypothetical protein
MYIKLCHTVLPVALTGLMVMRLPLGRRSTLLGTRRVSMRPAPQR